MRRNLLVTVASGLALSLLAIAAPGPGASADQLSDKQAQAEQISAKVDALNARIDALGEQYDQARVKLDQVQSDIDQATRQVESATAELGQRKHELAAYAVEAYMKGGESDLPEILLKGTGPEVGRQIEYLQAVSSNHRQLIDDVRAAQGSADAQLATLTDDKARAQALRDDLDQQRRDAEQASKEQQALLDGVTGEMADLVAQAQARQAAADQAAVQAQLASVAAPAPTAGPGPTTTTTRPGPGGPPPTTTPPPTTAPPVVRPPVVAPPPAPVPPGTPPPVLAIAARAIALARTQLGVPYVWAGADPSVGFDCSGLVLWAWRQVGRNFPHSAEMQYNMTRHIALSDLQPGDLVFYDTPIGHVGMYIGGGQMIEAPHTGANVRIASIFRAGLVGAGRVV